MKYILSLIFSFLYFFTYSQELVIEQIPGVFFNSPVDMTSTYMDGDARIFVTQKSGLIRILEDPEDLSPNILEDPFLDLSSVVDDGFEGGLLGLAFHPDYENNGYFYVNYTFQDPDNGGQFSTRISRFSVDESNPNLANSESELEVITISQPRKNHNGGDIAFGLDGYLYIPLGDGGGSGDQFKTAQNRQSLLGKVLRIDINTEPYSIPPDNPFVSDDETLDEIWTIGWRNPWKVAFDRETGDFWAADVGQNALEEVDFEPANSTGGLNYGWNCFEASEEFDDELCPDGISHTMPIFEYDHSQGWKSITGGHVYRGSNFPDLQGHYIFTDYEDSRVFWLTEQIAEGEFETVMFSFTEGNFPLNIATFGEASNGELYFTTLITGQLWKVGTNYVTNTIESPVSSFTLFPNPVHSLLEIRTEGNLENEVSIYSNAGQKFDVSIQGNKSIDVSSLNPGIYILHFTIDGKQVQEKFVKN